MYNYIIYIYIYIQNMLLCNCCVYTPQIHYRITLVVIAVCKNVNRWPWTQSWKSYELSARQCLLFPTLRPWKIEHEGRSAVWSLEWRFFHSGHGVQMMNWMNWITWTLNWSWTHMFMNSKANCADSNKASTIYTYMYIVHIYSLVFEWSKYFSMYLYI